METFCTEMRGGSIKFTIFNSCTTFIFFPRAKIMTTIIMLVAFYNGGKFCQSKSKHSGCPAWDRWDPWPFRCFANFFQQKAGWSLCVGPIWATSDVGLYIISLYNTSSAFWAFPDLDWMLDFIYVFMYEWMLLCIIHHIHHFHHIHHSWH